GSQDAFLAKIASTGLTLTYSTYLGTSGFDWSSGIAVDTAGNAYIAGYTSGATFPQVSPLQTSFQGMYDAFVAKFNAAGNGIAFSTFLGVPGSAKATAIALDASGNMFVAGQTASFDLPTQTPVQSANTAGVTGWIARLGVTAPPPQTPAVVS